MGGARESEGRGFRLLERRERGGVVGEERELRGNRKRSRRGEAAGREGS